MWLVSSQDRRLWGPPVGPAISHLSILCARPFHPSHPRAACEQNTFIYRSLASLLLPLPPTPTVRTPSFPGHWEGNQPFLPPLVLKHWSCPDSQTSIFSTISQGWWEAQCLNSPCLNEYGVILVFLLKDVLDSKFAFVWNFYVCLDTFSRVVELNNF